MKRARIAWRMKDGSKSGHGEYLEHDDEWWSSALKSRDTTNKETMEHWLEYERVEKN